MVAFIKAVLSFLTTIVCTIASPVFGNFAAGYAPSKDNCNLNFAVISDIHMTDETARRDMLALGLYDMDKAEEKLDALILAGDTTDMANSKQYTLVEDAFSKYTPADNIIMALGNHDTWNDENINDYRYIESERLFLEYNKKIANRDIDKVYYSTVVNGYTFLVMGSEYDHTDAYISAEQLDWLHRELNHAGADGKPVFVISHWPLANTHGLPDIWGSDGTFAENISADVENILQNYENVFMISGHIHSGLANNSIRGYSSVETHGNITSVNLPSYMYPGIAGSPSNGNGFVFEVYDDEVIIRARNFSGGVWYTSNVYNIALK